MLLFVIFLPALSFAAIESNRMVAMQMDSVNGNPTLRLVTEKPVGYRYTVYDSQDMSRVVLSFPHMEVAAIASLTPVDQPPVQQVEVSSHELTGGRMGRVEIVLSRMLAYDVAINGNQFELTLLRKSDQVTQDAEAAVFAETQPVASPALEPAGQTQQAALVVAAPQEVMTGPARSITDVAVRAQAVVLQADGLINKYRYFSLVGPERLVVDVYGVKPEFAARSFPLSENFSSMRVGVYRQKLRFVFDLSGPFPEYAVNSTGDRLMISWGAATSALSTPTH